MSKNIPDENWQTSPLWTDISVLVCRSLFRFSHFLLGYRSWLSCDGQLLSVERPLDPHEKCNSQPIQYWHTSPPKRRRTITKWWFIIAIQFRFQQWLGRGICSFAENRKTPNLNLVQCFSFVVLRFSAAGNGRINFGQTPACLVALIYQQQLW